MQSLLPWVRRVFWLSAAGLFTQIVLMLTMAVGLELSIHSLTRQNAQLATLYRQVQTNSDLVALTTYSSDVDSFFKTMNPIFSQLNWPLLALLTGAAGFAFLGYLFGRLSGTVEYAGALVVLSLIGGQNPVIVAMVLSDRGVEQATFGWPMQVLLLLSQLLILYAAAWLGQRAYLRGRRSVTTR